MPRESDETICRFAEEHERAEVVELFDEAFAGKFGSAVRDATRRKELFATALEIDNVIVAIRGGDIVGVAVLSFEGQPGFRSPKTGSVLSILGIVRTLRAAIVFALFRVLDWKPAAGAIYLEALSVSERARGHGVGTLLLSEIGTLAVDRGYQTVELSVVLENEDARRLYLRLGFREVAVKRSAVLDAVTGVAGARLMRSTIPLSLA